MAINWQQIKKERTALNKLLLGFDVKDLADVMPSIYSVLENETSLLIQEKAGQITASADNIAKLDMDARTERLQAQSIFLIGLGKVGHSLIVRTRYAQYLYLQSADKTQHEIADLTDQYKRKPPRKAGEQGERTNKLTSVFDRMARVFNRLPALSLAIALGDCSENLYRILDKVAKKVSIRLYADDTHRSEFWKWVARNLYNRIKVQSGPNRVVDCKNMTEVTALWEMTNPYSDDQKDRVKRHGKEAKAGTQAEELAGAILARTDKRRLSDIKGEMGDVVRSIAADMVKEAGLRAISPSSMLYPIIHSLDSLESGNTPAINYLNNALVKLDEIRARLITAREDLRVELAQQTLDGIAPAKNEPASKPNGNNGAGVDIDIIAQAVMFALQQSAKEEIAV